MMDALESRIESIETRNRAVSVDKAWETSLTRRVAICTATYITMLVTFLVPKSNPFLAALIPVTGFLLSTQSFPWLRRHWEKYYFRTKIK